MRKHSLLAAALAVAALLAPASGQAADALRLLATVSHAKAESAAEDAKAAEAQKAEPKASANTTRNAENVRSQAEKRLEQQRKDLTRNWGG